MVPGNRNKCISAVSPRSLYKRWRHHQMERSAQGVACQGCCTYGTQARGNCCAAGLRTTRCRAHFRQVPVSFATGLHRGSSSTLLYLIQPLPATSQAVKVLAFARDGLTLISGGEDTITAAWQLVNVLDQADHLAAPSGGMPPQALHTWWGLLCDVNVISDTQLFRPAFSTRQLALLSSHLRASPSLACLLRSSATHPPLPKAPSLSISDISRKISKLFNLCHQASIQGCMHMQLPGTSCKGLH